MYISLAYEIHAVNAAAVRRGNQESSTIPASDLDRDTFASFNTLNPAPEKSSGPKFVSDQPATYRIKPF